VSVVVHVRETGKPEPQHLSAADAALINSCPYATAKSLPDGRWLVKPSRAKVGVVRVGHLDLHFAPKLPLERVLFMLGYGVGRVDWDAHVGGDSLGAANGLVPAFANILARQAKRALDQGVLQGYRTAEATSTVLRGRLRETEQLIRAGACLCRWRSVSTNSPPTSRRTGSCGRRWGACSVFRVFIVISPRAGCSAGSCCGFLR
jgi:hypothetical protein